jgi:hypothetical protein
MPENASASPALPGHIFSPADIPAEVSGSLRERETERKKGERKRERELLQIIPLGQRLREEREDKRLNV